LMSIYLLIYQYSQNRVLSADFFSFFLGNVFVRGELEGRRISHLSTSARVTEWALLC